MRIERRRKKKLRVAFHFQYANQAAWKCDTCRQRGLEGHRRCDWIPEERRAAPRCVWAREGVAITSCPTSYITAESISLLEEFHAWKLFNCANLYDVPARAAEAYCVLEGELRLEQRRAAE